MSLRKEMEDLVWKATHADFKSSTGGQRSIMYLDKGGTTLGPLSSVPDDVLLDKYTSAVAGELTAKLKAESAFAHFPVPAVGIGKLNYEMTEVKKVFTLIEKRGITSMLRRVSDTLEDRLMEARHALKQLKGKKARSGAAHTINNFEDVQRLILNLINHNKAALRHVDGKEYLGVSSTDVLYLISRIGIPGILMACGWYAGYAGERYGGEAKTEQQKALVELAKDLERRAMQTQHAHYF